MFPSVGLEWVPGLDGSGKSILRILSFNSGTSTNEALLSAHSSHGQVALKGSAEDLGLEEKAAPEAGQGLGSLDALQGIVPLQNGGAGIWSRRSTGRGETLLECEQTWCLEDKGKCH